MEIKTLMLRVVTRKKEGEVSKELSPELAQDDIHTQKVQ